MRTPLTSRVPRRLAAALVAASVVVAPIIAAAPASAAIVPITAFTLPGDVLTFDENIVAYYNDDPTLTELETVDMCQAIYIDGRSAYEPNPVGKVGVVMDWYGLTFNYRAEVGNVVTVGYFARDNSKSEPCEVPPMADLTIKDSVVMGPAPVEGAEIAVDVAPLKLTRGVAVDMLLPFTTAAGFDWSDGGFIGAGSYLGGDESLGLIDPFEGLVFQPLHTEEPGVVPQLRITGTPKFSGSALGYYELSDGLNFGFGSFPVTIADSSGAATPIAIDVAVGQPVAGARVAIVAAGLQPGAAWSATVRSTPVIVGSGSVSADGTIASAVRIPAGLDAGIHSITVTSTRADGSAFAAVLYLRVSATGTLLALYNSNPELAATGASPAPAALLGGGLMLAGFAFAAVSAVRRRRV